MMRTMARNSKAGVEVKKKNDLKNYVDLKISRLKKKTKKKHLLYDLNILLE
jgi:bifunctional N-acetylglucosamine-1-phosphate-uridyltransferase/glucosamine-1-phosphate-acetyltransferase GlmU-like protein